MRSRNVLAAVIGMLAVGLTAAPASATFGVGGSAVPIGGPGVVVVAATTVVIVPCERLGWDDVPDLISISTVCRAGDLDDDDETRDEAEQRRGRELRSPRYGHRPRRR